MAVIYKWDLNLGIEEIEAQIAGKKECFTVLSMQTKDSGECHIEIAHDCKAVYGMGERFNLVNQKGLEIETEVVEKFCNQGSVSYCPVPFFFTDKQFGVFVDTLAVTRFKFENKIKIDIKKDSNKKLPCIYFFKGSPTEILADFTEITGKPALIPKWCFTPWMSANRWNTQEEALQQARLAKKYGIPHGVMVLEAWSDEATFYRFNEHGEWQNPEEFVQILKSMGIHLILWQIPVLKKMEQGENHDILDLDWEYAIRKNLCIKNTDGTVYRIPEGHWFAGSLLPDFTNPETIEWWFGKRDYLLAMGVSGFKTDGGEFVLTDDVTAFNGMTGIELRNYYAKSYVKAYTEFVGKDRVLFSRAGYTGQQNYPIQWAGDQISSWEEFRHVIIAGLSAGLSGIPFWGFDIGGFAGEMPTKELYERAVQCAVFAPIMQWHSEPVGGQFSEVLTVTWGVNDRSPWNVSKMYGDEQLLKRLRFHFNLRMNLLPYLYQQAVISSKTGTPMMKHLAVEYPEDERVYDVVDCFMLGELLIAPIMEEGQSGRNVYLPDGEWNCLWPLRVWNEELGEWTEGEVLRGRRDYFVNCGSDRIPVFIRRGSCIALNLGATLELGSFVGNRTDKYVQLTFWAVGERGRYHFFDDMDNELIISWEKGKNEVERLSGEEKFVLFSNGQRIFDTEMTWQKG